jgi:hypothetical protein
MISGKTISVSNGENIRERASLSSNLAPFDFQYIDRVSIYNGEGSINTA